MRILKKGSLKPVEYWHICRKCKTEFAATIEDTRMGQYNESIVKCPLCGAYISFSKDKPIKED